MLSSSGVFTFINCACRYPNRADVQLIQVIGENLPSCIRTGNNILEFMTKDGLLTSFYEAGLGLDAANRWIGRMAKQISHRYPHMHVLEIGKYYLVIKYIVL